MRRLANVALTRSQLGLVVVANTEAAAPTWWVSHLTICGSNDMPMGSMARLISFAYYHPPPPLKCMVSLLNEDCLTGLYLVEGICRVLCPKVPGFPRTPVLPYPGILLSVKMSCGQLTANDRRDLDADTLLPSSAITLHRQHMLRQARCGL